MTGSVNAKVLYSDQDARAKLLVLAYEAARAGQPVRMAHRYDQNWWFEVQIGACPATDEPLLPPQEQSR